MPFWIYLIVAVIVGAIPPRWLWDGRMIFLDGSQFRTRIVMHNPGDNRRRRRWWKSKVIWIEPLRGALAGWGLKQGLVLWMPLVERSTAKELGYTGLILIVVFAACQTRGREKEGECIVPLLFAAGLIGGYFGWFFGFSTLAIGIMALMGTQSLGMTVFAMAGSLVLLGGFMWGNWIRILSSTLVAGFPLIRMLLFNRKLVLAIRG